MIGIKTGKQIFSRILRSGCFGSNVKINFLNRRGLKIYVSKEPIKEMYIKLPYVENYNKEIEQDILNFINRNK